MNQLIIFLNKKFINAGIVAIILSVPVKTFANQFDYENLEKNAKNELNLIKIGNNPEAIKILESKISNNPDNPYLFYLLGRAYGNLKQLEISEDYFNKALKIDPKYPKIYLSYALLKGKKGEIKESIKLLDKAIELKPNYPQAFTNRGVAKGALSDNLGAIEDFNAAIKIDPYLSDPYRNRGITNELIGNLKGACKDWKISSSLGENQTKEWYENQCKNIVELRNAEKENIISSLEESNKRLRKEIDVLKNTSESLETISVGDITSLENESVSSMSNENMTKNNILFPEKKSNLITLKQSNLVDKSNTNLINENEKIPFSNDLKISSQFSGIYFIDNTNKKIYEDFLRQNIKLLTLEQIENSYENSLKDEITENEKDKLKKNPLIPNFTYFILGVIFPIILLKLSNSYKLSLKRINNKFKKENTNIGLENESIKLKKTIEENYLELNNLTLQKEIIEKRIIEIKYDIDYFSVKQANLKVYTLEKYKELFSINNSKLNNNSSNNLNNFKYNLSLNDSDTKNLSFLNNNTFSF